MFAANINNKSRVKYAVFDIYDSHDTFSVVFGPCAVDLLIRQHHVARVRAFLTMRGIGSQRLPPVKLTLDWLPRFQIA